MSHLDPILASYLADLKERGVPPIYELTAQEGRRMFRARTAMLRALQPPPRVARVTDAALHGPGGRLPIRIYRPDGRPGRPTILYLHGGGFVICDLETHDSICRHLALDARAVVVSLDYRLAPEHPFPAAIEDTRYAARWVATNLRSLGGSPAWGLAGDSAGGNLVAVTTHTLRDQERAGSPLPRPAAQLLLYPSVDPAGDYESRRRLAVGFGLEEASIRYFLTMYAGTWKPHRLTDPRYSPLRYPDHSSLPPAIVTTAGFDPLQDEGFAYSDALRAVGVPVEHRHEPTLIHGYGDLGPMVPQAGVAMRQVGLRFGELLRQRPGD